MGFAKKKIVLFAAEPTDTARLRLQEEFREIQEELKLSRNRDAFDLKPVLAARTRDLQDALRNEQPQIVHFSGHGTEAGELLVEDPVGGAHPIAPAALANLFRLCTHHVECVVLNACYSEIQAQAIAEHIPYVIGTSTALDDRAAIAFSIGFYRALGDGKPFDEAFQWGSSQLGLEFCGQASPVMIRQQDILAPAGENTKIVITGDTPSPLNEVRYIKIGAPAPLRWFVGRNPEIEDLDHVILNNETSTKSLIAILGIGGQGKSVLAFNWLTHRLNSCLHRFELVVFFSAYRYGGTFEEFLRTTFSALSGNAAPTTSTESLASLTVRMLEATKALIVIDGLERWLRGWQDTDDLQDVTSAADRGEGRIARGLDSFLHDCASFHNGTRVLFTSRALPKALDDSQVVSVSAQTTGSSTATLQGLTIPDGIQLLRLLGIIADDTELRKIVEDFRGHPLALTVLARHSLHRKRDAKDTDQLSVHEILQGIYDDLGDESSPHLENFDCKLRKLFDDLKRAKANEIPLLRVVSACRGDTPVDAISAALNVPTAEIPTIRARLAGLQDWGLVTLYNAPHGSTWAALHPLVKKHFRPNPEEPDFKDIHRRLSSFFESIPIPANARTLLEIQPRLWCIEHKTLAGDFDAASRLLFADLSGTYCLANWFVQWGYAEFEITLEKGLLSNVAQSDNKRLIIRSLATNLSTLGRIDEALTYLALRDQLED